MKKLLLIFSCIAVLTVNAKEGMWIPIFLKGALMDEMKLNGLKLEAEDIYDINKSSLKDAVVLFGGGCTAELISSEGLLLTNHHCGYGRIQSHSSVENDYLTDGYWAMTKEQELKNPGLTASIFDRMKDVTSTVLEGVTDGMDEEARSKVIDKHIAELTKKYEESGEYKVVVKGFYYGNQYLLFLLKEFGDVRLVGAPPSSIGKYGFDTDNWVWPRHTGDFSIFRIYASPENKPAAISDDNVPYKPVSHLPISLDGYENGDFTMVYGFPYRTDEYLTASAVEHIVNISNPKKIEIRTKKLDVLNERMRESDAVRIKYAAKQSSTSNAWKKWQGQNKGLKKNKAIQSKKEKEEKLKFKIELYPDSFAEYRGVLEDLEDASKEMNEVSLARDYYIEIGYYGVDALNLAYRLISYFNKAKEGTLEEVDLSKMRKQLESFFKDYDKRTDGEVFEALMPIYFDAEDNFYKPEIISEISKKHSKDLAGYIKETYSNSLLTNQAELNALIDKGSKGVLKLEKDELFQLAFGLSEFYRNNISTAYNALNARIETLNRRYLQTLIAVFPDELYYPDANGTLRLTYGKVEGMKPNDAVRYNYYTTLEGVMEKYIPESEEYDLPGKLIELYNNQDYGPYAEGGKMRVCFIASNHTSGGNSGSPVLNGSGQLIGLNFDRNWEGTMSDIMYDANQCRNISVDIRYVLFIIDKFANAGHLIQEMTIVKKEAKSVEESKNVKVSKKN